MQIYKKENPLDNLPFNERLTYDLKAFEYSKYLFIIKAWELLKEIGIVSSLVHGVPIRQLMKEKNIKNKNMLECMLDTLVSGGILRKKGNKYIFIKQPENPKAQHMEFLEKYYNGSLNWFNFVFSRAKKTLKGGKPPIDTGFEQKRSLDLWDTIMSESPYSARIIAIKKFTSDLKENASVLDLGCGGGIGLEFILRNTNKKIKLFGADVSKAYLKRAKNRMKKLLLETQNETIKENIKNLKFMNLEDGKGPPKNRKYDVIFISIILNHIKTERHEDFFKNVAESLKEGGIFVSYQLIHQSKTDKNPICWIMHTVPTHIEYPFKEEYLNKLKKYFKTVEEYLGGTIIIAKNNVIP